MIFAVLIQFYLELLVCSLINTIDLSSREREAYASKGMVSGVTISIIALIVCLPAPFGLLVFLKIKRKSLEEAPFKTVFGSLYWDIDTSRNAYYYVFYLLRRMLFALTATLLTNSPMQQLHLSAIASFIMIALSITTKPFENKLFQTLELFNEASIYVLSILYMTFTDVVDGEGLKIGMGWACTAIILFNFIGNILILAGKIIMQVYSFVKKLRGKRKTTESKENILGVTTGIAFVENDVTKGRMSKLESIQEEQAESEGDHNLVIKSHREVQSKHKSSLSYIGRGKHALTQEQKNLSNHQIMEEKLEWETEEKKEIERWSEQEAEAHENIDFQEKDKDLGSSKKNQGLWQGSLHF